MEQTKQKSYHTHVECLLRVEADAITRTATRLNAEAVNRLIELLVACQGKIILIGVGKSGNIGAKIAATMASTGTAALYLHPSDALHGGLGIVTSEDIVIVLSNSGETEEIVDLLPSLKNRRVPLVAIVGNLHSTLARKAEIVLDASVDREACPLNLAPTASTTVALALGDAIAMTLMAAKGRTIEDFAVNHPAGRLGKRLTMRVRDLMHAEAHNPVISADRRLLDAIEAIGRGGLGAVNVIDDDGKLLGIITDGDVRRAIGRRSFAELESLLVRDIMTRHPVTSTPDALAYDALKLMENRASQISVLPIVEADNRCIGMLRLHDIVRSGL